MQHLQSHVLMIDQQVDQKRNWGEEEEKKKEKEEEKVHEGQKNVMQIDTVMPGHNLYVYHVHVAMYEVHV